MRRSAYLLLTFALWLLCTTEALAFDPLVIGQSERLVAALRDDLTRIEKDLQLPNITEDQIGNDRRELEDIRSQAVSGSQSLTAPIAEVSRQLASLGPAPAVGAVEDKSIADRRNTLTASLNRLQATAKELDLIIVQAEQLVEQVAASQRSQFFQRTLEPNRSVLNPALWADGFSGAVILVQRLGSLLGNWWSEISRTANLIILTLAPALLAGAVILYRIARRWLNHRYGAVLRLRREPDETDRLWRIVRGALFAFLVASAFIFILYVTFRAAQVLTLRFEKLFSALGDLVIFTALMGAAAHRLAAPGEPQWRIINADDQAAARFASLAALAAFVANGERFFAEVSSLLYLPVGFAAAESASAALLIILLVGGIIIVLRDQPGRGEQARGDLYFRWLIPLVPLIWVILGAAAAALLLGYLALASFITEQFIDTAFLVAGLLVLHHLSEAVVVSSLDPKSRVGQALRRVTGLGSRGAARLGLLLRTVIDLMLAFVGLPLLLLKWTVTWIDFGSWLNAALIGFTIGSVTISLANVFLVLLIVTAGIIITKLATRWLDLRVLAETSIDRGVRDSITKGVSYGGYVVAAGFGLSAAGVNFSNIAIIAGALGVGIGFGLQSIVNNFISGLILLAERPVRVGDWVQVSSGEGIVRRINVRSTEIETFDNCTIVVPNSSLITEAVKNWTHHDTIGRFRLTLSVPYDSDAQFVKDAMLQLARGHALVLHLPEPKVLLTGFGTTTLDFELRAFVGDILNAQEVASDIRFDLLTAVRQKGIGAAAPVIHDVRIIDGSLPAQAQQATAQKS